ncbi:hypothetical protein M408DRAFT_333607 [Serendipita vermifera MAFF 305830]|uniref:Uncharacterized protein n=1 Tax=Serendipita vermifera MAFF 305830 TaxID=933852 RepID=A0A0C2WUV6_SERVB|nr:hypothetical protein M408DRAFT_333607 [Serendipita vermifera MAFF 305830]
MPQRSWGLLDVALSLSFDAYLLNADLDPVDGAAVWAFANTIQLGKPDEIRFGGAHGNKSSPSVDPRLAVIDCLLEILAAAPGM